jgi:hypothetical protein
MSPVIKPPALKLPLNQDVTGINLLQATGHTELNGGLDVYGTTTFHGPVNGLPAATVGTGITLFDTQTISVNTATIRIPASGTFPLTSSTIEIHYRARSSVATDASAVGMTFNGDSSGNYSGEFIQGLGTTASANEQNAQNFIHPNWIIPGTQPFAQSYGWGRIFIPFYASSLQPKGVRIDFNSIAAHAAGAASGLYTVSLGAYWNSGAVIQYIAIGPTGGFASAQFNTYLWP